MEGKQLHITIPSLLSNTEYHVHLDRIAAVASTNAFPEVTNVFQIATTDFIYSLKAESDQERKEWIQNLELIIQQSKSNAEIPFAAETKVLQHYAEVKAGLLSFWSRQFICLYGIQLFYFKSHDVNIPTKRISVSDFVSVDISDKEPGLAFQLTLKDGTILHHKLESAPVRDMWLSTLNKTRLGSINLLSLMDSKVEDSKVPMIEIDYSDVKVGKQKLLIKITGRRIIRVQLVPVSPSSLSSESVFILDAGQTLYQWNGAKANRIAKAKGLDISNRIRLKERGGKAKVVLQEEGKEFGEEFWKDLGGKPTKIELLENPNEDGIPLNVSIYRISEDSIYMIHDGTICSKDKLDSRYCKIVETEAEIYIWQGKECSSSAAKTNASKWLKHLANQKKRKFVYTAKIVENTETVLFKEKFTDYPSILPISTAKVELKGNIADTLKQETIDVMQMHAKNNIKETLIDDGKGKIQIWRVKDFEKELFPRELFG